MVTSSVWNFSGPSTLNYPPERSSLPVRPRKRCGLSSAVQAAVEENLGDSVIRVTDGRTRLERHLRPSLRWRSCHVNPAWEEIHTSQSITDEEVTKRTQSTSSFFRLLIFIAFSRSFSWAIRPWSLPAWNCTFDYSLKGKCRWPHFYNCMLYHLRR